jgi:hypothetical protein
MSRAESKAEVDDELACLVLACRSKAGVKSVLRRCNRSNQNGNEARVPIAPSNSDTGLKHFAAGNGGDHDEEADPSL